MSTPLDFPTPPKASAPNQAVTNSQLNTFSAANAEQGPALLPKRRGRKPGSLNRPKVDASAVPEVIPEGDRKLPEDPGEFDKAIAPCKVMIRPVLHGISRLAQTLGTDALDKDEIDSGTVAFGALMYQYGGLLDAKVLVLLWCAGVSIPRVVQYLDQRREAAKKLAVTSEREVSGERIG